MSPGSDFKVDLGARVSPGSDFKVDLGDPASPGSNFEVDLGACVSLGSKFEVDPGAHVSLVSTLRFRRDRQLSLDAFGILASLAHVSLPMDFQVRSEARVSLRDNG